MDIHGVWTSIPQLESFSTTQGLANSPKENLTMATFENAMPSKIAVKNPLSRGFVAVSLTQTRGQSQDFSPC
jgi:hypothetical protein